MGKRIEPMLVIDDEKSNSDLVFCGSVGSLSSMYNRDIQEARHDKNYDTPDEYTHVYTNISAGVYQSSNGVVKIIRNNLAGVSRFLNHYNPGEAKGVIVVKYHNLTRPVNRDNKLRNYYENTLGNLPGSVAVETIGRVKSFLNFSNPTQVLKIRYIKFIPESIIDEKGVYHDEFSNSKFTIFDPAKFDIIKDGAETDIKITLSSDKKSKYFVKLGDAVIPVHTELNGNKAISGNIEISSLGDSKISDEITVDNMHKYGVYNSAEEAVEKTDMSKQLESKKLDLEKFKLETDKEILNLKLNNAREINIADKYKRDAEERSMNTKENVEKMKIGKVIAMEIVKPLIMGSFNIANHFIKVKGI